MILNIESQQRPRVFVLDEDPEMGRLVEKILLRLDCEVASSHCAKEALEELLTGTYDLLITDLRIPGMDGVNLLRICSEALPDLRILVTSTYGDLEDYRSAMQAGAFGYLPKPLSIRELQELTQNALSS